MVFTEKQQTPNMRMFENVIPYGNAKAYWDVSAPANTAYFLNTNHMEFCYFPQKSYRNGGGDIQGDAGSEYFGVRTDYDIKQGGHLAVAVMCANLWANPFYQGVAYNFA